MCGIIAFRDSSVEDKVTTIQAMMSMIQHRGPSLEGSGYYVNDQVAIGFRRLSVIDLKSGMQPIYNADRSILIAFNGEIYNFRTLRQHLIDKGYTFSTKSDTEVLLHGYEEWGMQGVLDRVRGMFAFVIWDNNSQVLYGARDFFGIKPLYYYKVGDTFIVGSEIKAFFRQPNFKREMNQNAVKPFLMNQYNDLKETFFKNVQRFPAGHWFELHGRDMQIHEYWDATYNINRHRGAKRTADIIEDTVEESVDLHRIADVSVGSFLSEGVDSSFITTLLRPQEVFSANFNQGPFDETGPAKSLAEHDGLNFNKVTVNADESFRDFPEMQYHLDEPDANPSVIPLWYLCRLARKKVTVVLSGEGADELFAGYMNYGMHTKSKAFRVLATLLGRLPTRARRRVSKAIRGLPDFPGKLELFTHTANPADYYAGQSVGYDMYQPSILTSQQANAILRPPFQNNLTISEIYQEDFRKVRSAEDIKQMQYIDLHHFMLNDILQKADKISMAHSLELRVPYLDRKVAELANTIPSAMLVNSKGCKNIFRRAAARHLPKAWAKRPKLGFPTPIKTWLREEEYYKQVRELFSQEWVNQIFEQSKILDLLDRNFAQKTDARRPIWNIFTFLTWYRLFFIDFEETVKKYEHLQPDVQNLVDKGILV